MVARNIHLVKNECFRKKLCVCAQFYGNPRTGTQDSKILQELELGHGKPAATEAALLGAFSGVSAYLCISVLYSLNFSCALPIIALSNYVTL